MRLPVKGSPMAKPKPMVPAKAKSVNLDWCYAARGARGKILRRIWDIQGMSMKVKVVIVVQEDLYGPPRNQKSNVLKRGDRKMLKIQIPGNTVTRRNLRTLLVQGDLYGQQPQEQSFKT